MWTTDEIGEMASAFNAMQDRTGIGRPQMKEPLNACTGKSGTDRGRRSPSG